MAQKKQLLFVCYGLGIGGIEKCLVNLLNTLPEDVYDADLLVMDPIYDMLPQIRRKIHMVDPFDYTFNTEFTMQEIRNRGGIFKHPDKLVPYLEHRIRIKLGLPLWTQFKGIEKHYDVAIAYSQNGNGPYYVADKIRANRKVLWYHNGAYESTGKAYARDREYYGKFDTIVAVSRDCAAMLREKFPEHSSKIMVLHNLCDAQDIRQKAGAFVPDSFSADMPHLVTVGRLSEEKGVYLAMEACRILQKQNLRFCWHWIGDGVLREEAKAAIARDGLEGCFRLEGSQTNPYPYIAHADIYVQPSRYEAYSTTVTEAKVLHRPMVATDVGGMHDQLIPGKTGLIVPGNARDLAEAVGRLLEDQPLRASFEEALQKEGIDSHREFAEYERTVFR